MEGKKRRMFEQHRTSARLKAGGGWQIFKRGHHRGVCSEGTFENSPAFQRREQWKQSQVPQGRPRLSDLNLQPFLRNWGHSGKVPGVETPGYFQTSLRDN